MRPQAAHGQTRAAAPARARRPRTGARPALADGLVNTGVPSAAQRSRAPGDTLHPDHPAAMAAPAADRLRTMRTRRRGHVPNRPSSATVAPVVRCQHRHPAVRSACSARPVIRRRLAQPQRQLVDLPRGRQCRATAQRIAQAALAGCAPVRRGSRPRRPQPPWRPSTRTLSPFSAPARQRSRQRRQRAALHLLELLGQFPAQRRLPLRPGNLDQLG